jgi:hypothetical protein
MSDHLNSKSPPDEVLRYAPNRQRYPGYRSAQAGVSDDAFSEEENPSYCSMAQMFAPEPERSRKPRSNNQTVKMLIRSGAVVGAAALALFIAYIATQPDQLEADAQTAERFKGVSNAVAAVRTAVIRLPAPATVPQQSDPPAVKTVPSQRAEPAPDASDVSTDRGSAPTLAPVEPVRAAAPPPAPAPKVAALQPELRPAPPEPVHNVPQLTANELAILMARGRRLMESGDLSSARPVYRRAAEAGYAEAALALGETYDPVTMRERRVFGMVPDVKQARHWYERARDLGSPEAPTRLQRLAGQ